MIDTDFASNVLSYMESDLSDDTLQRCTAPDVGKTTNMVVGQQWRSVDVSSFSVTDISNC
jgi:CheY-specific phosphatase CheX